MGENYISLSDTENVIKAMKWFNENNEKIDKNNSILVLYALCMIGVKYLFLKLRLLG